MNKQSYAAAWDVTHTKVTFSDKRVVVLGAFTALAGQHSFGA